MRQVRTMPILITLLLALMVASVGCKKQDVEVVPAPDSTPRTPAEPPPPPPAEPEPRDEFPSEPDPVMEDVDLDAAELARQLQTIYFAYDSDELTSEARQKLQNNAQVLKDHDRWNIVIQGHADERGTIEYNLALGQRRADAVRDYLATLGVDRSRLRVVSFGEERPAVQGGGENSWSQNRRAEFEPEQR